MTLSRFLAGTALTAIVLGGAACSLVLKTDSEQCNTNSDCTARGTAFANTMCTNNVCVANGLPDSGADSGAPDPKWGCIGEVPPLDAGSMMTFKLQLLDLISNAPVTQNLDVKLCAKLDPTCQTPLGCSASDAGCPVVSTLTPDSMGNVSAMVASNFDGYLDIDDTSGTYVPSLVFVDLAVVHVSANSQVLLVTKSAESGLATNAMVTINPADALLLVPIVDCTGARTAGASAALSPAQAGATEFYDINSALMTSATQTDSSGNMGFVNVTAPASVTVIGTVAATGKEFGKVTTLVRAGGMTYQILRPTTNL
jgi:hypothetical protein